METFFFLFHLLIVLTFDSNNFIIYPGKWCEEKSETEMSRNNHLSFQKLQKTCSLMNEWMNE